MSVFVGRLSHRFSDRKYEKENDEEIRDYFKDCGKINKVEIRTGRNYAYAFLYFDDEKGADEAIRLKDGKEWYGNRIVVEKQNARNSRKSDRRDSYYRDRRDRYDDRHDRYNRRDSYSRHRRSRSRSSERRRHSRSPSRSRSRDRPSSRHPSRDSEERK